MARNITHENSHKNSFPSKPHARKQTQGQDLPTEAGGQGLAQVLPVAQTGTGGRPHWVPPGPSSAPAPVVVVAVRTGAESAVSPAQTRQPVMVRFGDRTGEENASVRTSILREDGEVGEQGRKVHVEKAS